MSRTTDSSANRLMGAVLAGVLLLAVPTAFSVFPEIADWPAWVRGVVVLLWILVAISAVGTTTSRDQRMESLARDLTGDKLELRKQLRLSAFGFSIRNMTFPAANEIPPSYEFYIYVFEPPSEILNVIYPKWEGEGEDLRGFTPGNGATGEAWQRGDLVVVKGEAVSNTRYGLTEAQQAEFVDYRRAVAYPLYEDAVEKFGVLTALSKEEDDFFDGAPGQALFRELANAIAVILLTVPVESVPRSG